jgi:hypothetical protein
MRTIKENLDYICSLLELDLDIGPCITGSTLTWLHEDSPDWLPDDLDIVCFNDEQYDKVVAVLEPLSTESKYSNWLNSRSIYYMIDSYKVQVFKDYISKDIDDRIDIIGFPCTSAAYDGKIFKYHKNFIMNIRNKLLVYSPKKIIYPYDNVLLNYDKCISRGYVDIDGKAIQNIKTLYSRK